MDSAVILFFLFTFRHNLLPFALVLLLIISSNLWAYQLKMYNLNLSASLSSEYCPSEEEITRLLEFKSSIPASNSSEPLSWPGNVVVKTILRLATKAVSFGSNVTEACILDGNVTGCVSINKLMNTTRNILSKNKIALVECYFVSMQVFKVVVVGCSVTAIYSLCASGEKSQLTHFSDSKLDSMGKIRLEFQQISIAEAGLSDLGLIYTSFTSLVNFIGDFFRNVLYQPIPTRSNITPGQCIVLLLLFLCFFPSGSCLNTLTHTSESEHDTCKGQPLECSRYDLVANMEMMELKQNMLTVKSSMTVLGSTQVRKKSSIVFSGSGKCFTNSIDKSRINFTTIVKRTSKKCRIGDGQSSLSIPSDLFSETSQSQMKRVSMPTSIPPTYILTSKPTTMPTSMPTSTPTSTPTPMPSAHIVLDMFLSKPLHIWNSAWDSIVNLLFCQHNPMDSFLRVMANSFLKLVPTIIPAVCLLYLMRHHIIHTFNVNGPVSELNQDNALSAILPNPITVLPDRSINNYVFYDSVPVQFPFLPNLYERCDVPVDCTSSGKTEEAPNILNFLMLSRQSMTIPQRFELALPIVTLPRNTCPENLGVIAQETCYLEEDNHSHSFEDPLEGSEVLYEHPSSIKGFLSNRKALI